MKMIMHKNILNKTSPSLVQWRTETSGDVGKIQSSK